MAMCKDMNPKVRYAYDNIIVAKTPDTQFVLSEGFKSKEEVEKYYRIKLLQLSEFAKNLKEGDKIKTMDSEYCRVIFKDPIMDDSWYDRYKESKNDGDRSEL